MQYFTGSKAHNVALRQRALKMGYTLSEYSLAKLDTEKPVAGKTEEEIYAKLKLDYIPPELRENLGEIDAAEAHTLPVLLTQADLQGDVHMHTVETDGRNTIEEMAEAAAHGYKYMAITDLKVLRSPTARRQARGRTYQAHSRASARWTISRSWPASRWTSGRRHPRPLRFCAPSRWTSSSPACTPASTGARPNG
jgi:hypothetical protein